MLGGRGRRILIDGTMARGGGGFTYLVNILPKLCASAPTDQFRVLVRSERLARSIPRAVNLAVDLLPAVGWLGRIRFTYREIPRLAREWGADLFFSAGESAPLASSCPMIASLRNPFVFTALDRNFFSWKERLRILLLRQAARVSARVCDRLMFVSADSAAAIGDRIGIPPRRRSVIHHGIDALAWQRTGERSSLAFPYILSVSSIYRYKNFVRLIEAYADLARRRPEVPALVIVGDVCDALVRSEMEQARAAAGTGVSERIHIVGEVSYAEIKQYYAGASLFVFPSYLESFGHPLLEAMASDLPVVAADIPNSREVAGDAAIYADPHDAKSLADAIEAALSSELAQALIRRGRRRVRHFQWDASAQRLLTLFDEVLAEREAAHPAQLGIDRPLLSGTSP